MLHYPWFANAVTFWQPNVHTCRPEVPFWKPRNRSFYTMQLAGIKSKILKGQIKFRGSGDCYQKDVHVLKASAWPSCKELGGWKCVTAGAKWSLNTSLRGVTLSNPFSMSLCLFSLLPSLTRFYCIQRDTQEANDLWFPKQPIDYQMQ